MITLCPALNSLIVWFAKLYYTNYCNQYWRDEVLVWKPKDYGGVEEIHLPPSMIWRPDIILHNKWVFSIWFGNSFCHRFIYCVALLQYLTYKYSPKAQNLKMTNCSSICLLCLMSFIWVGIGEVPFDDSLIAQVFTQNYRLINTLIHWLILIIYLLNFHWSCSKWKQSILCLHLKDQIFWN